MLVCVCTQDGGERRERKESMLRKDLQNFKNFIFKIFLAYSLYSSDYNEYVNFITRKTVKLCTQFEKKKTARCFGKNVFNV